MVLLPTISLCFIHWFNGDLRGGGVMSRWVEAFSIQGFAVCLVVDKAGQTQPGRGLRESSEVSADIGAGGVGRGGAGQL